MAGGIPLDPDAQAFLNAAGITDATITTAIDTLVIQLKAIGVWTKMKALYPFVGGTATTHKFNLKDPRDLDAAFRLSFVGGFTHSANGALPNGTNAYMNTNFNPLSQNVVKSNFGVSFYSRTNSTGTYADIGAVSGTSYIMMRVTNASTDTIGVYDDSNFYGNYVSNALGLFTVQRDSSTTQKFYQAGVLKAQRTGFAATADINLNIYISARNLFNGTAATFSNRECAFAAFHDSFTSTEAANYYTAVQAFQTTLNRQV